MVLINTVLRRRTRAKAKETGQGFFRLLLRKQVFAGE